MATFPSTQDVTQFLGSSPGTPINFNPNQQSPSNMMPQPHPQQSIQQPPSPYMPQNGPYNPYMQGWGRLMGGPSPNGGASPQSMQRPITLGGMMPQTGGMMPGGPSGMPMTNPSMMQSMFSHMPMVR